MAQAGQMLENPLTGARTIFHQTAQETDGALLQIEEVRGTDFTGPPAHIHLHQEERFHVLSGIARIQVSGKEYLLRTGESIAAAPGVPHTWANGGMDKVRVMCEFRPALNMEHYFESLYAIPSPRNAKKAGSLVRPSFFQMILLALTYESFLAGPPVILQKVFFTLLKPIALLLGYRSRYGSPPQHAQQGSEQI